MNKRLYALPLSRPSSHLFFIFFGLGNRKHFIIFSFLFYSFIIHSLVIESSIPDFLISSGSLPLPITIILATPLRPLSRRRYPILKPSQCNTKKHVHSFIPCLSFFLSLYSILSISLPLILISLSFSHPLSLTIITQTCFLATTTPRTPTPHARMKPATLSFFHEGWFFFHFIYYLFIFFRLDTTMVMIHYVFY
jgi:hypothetical protein